MATNKELTNVIIQITIVIVVAYLIYLFLKSQGIIGKSYPTSSAASATCPRGPAYTRGFFGDCDPNYQLDTWDNFFAGGTCKCESTA